MRTITLRSVSKHAKNDHAGTSFVFNSERWFQGSRVADLCFDHQAEDKDKPTKTDSAKKKEGTSGSERVGLHFKQVFQNLLWFLSFFLVGYLAECQDATGTVHVEFS